MIKVAAHPSNPTLIIFFKCGKIKAIRRERVECLPPTMARSKYVCSASHFGHLRHAIHDRGTIYRMVGTPLVYCDGDVMIDFTIAGAINSINWVEGRHSFVMKNFSSIVCTRYPASADPLYPNIVAHTYDGKIHAVSYGNVQMNNRYRVAATRAFLATGTRYGENISQMTEMILLYT